MSTTTTTRLSERELSRIAIDAARSRRGSETERFDAAYAAVRPMLTARAQYPALADEWAATIAADAVSGYTGPGYCVAR